MSATDRALLAVLCGLGLVLAASLLPGAGVGSHPAAGDSGSPGPTAAPGTDGTPVPSAGGPGEGTPSSTPSEESTPTPADEGTPTPDPTPDSTPDPTATATPTATPTDEAGGGGGFPLFPAAVVGVALVLVAAWRAGDASTEPAGSGGSPGPPTTGVGRIRLGLGRLVGGASRGTMAFVVTLSTATVDLFDAVGVALREVSVGLAHVSADVPGPGRLVGGLASALSGSATGLGSALLSLPGAFSLGGGDDGWNGATTTDAREHAPDPEAEDDHGPASIEDAWTAMATTVPVDDRETRTPAELARAAVAAGLPSEPVRQLTRAFREVTYGGLPRTRERRRRALEALQRLRQGEDEE